MLTPITPGEILLEEFLLPLSISQNKLALEIAVQVSRVSGIIKREHTITADTALRLATYFGTSPAMWMSLQSEYDLRIAKYAHGDEIASRIIAHKRDVIASAA